MYLLEASTLQGGKYNIVRFLSSGGFGNTYEGIHTLMDTRVAIKEFFPKMFCNRDENTSHVTVATQGNRELVDKLRKKFNEEAKAVFQMKHDNIVRVLDIFEENGTAYYVMEYIDGKSLNDIVKEHGALPEAEAVGYIRQVADALKYVHSLNRLHLDIKPGNIMVDKNGKVILIDFGASKHYDDESGENTSTLMGVNTKGYAPIEQTTQSFTSFSPATDIYALGATLYRLLSGTVPPDANLLLAEEEKLDPIPSCISESTKKAVVKAMALRRKERPQSIDEFLGLLEVNMTSSTISGNNNGIINQDNEETVIDSSDKSNSNNHFVSNWFTEDDVNQLIIKSGYQYSQNECFIALQYTKGNLAEALDYLRLGDNSIQDTSEKTMSEDLIWIDRVLFEVEDKKNYKKAFFLSQKYANQGNAQAQYLLSMCYYCGWGVDSNVEEGTKWLQKSAAGNDSDAQCTLGLYHETGLHVHKSKKEAVYYYRLFLNNPNRNNDDYDIPAIEEKVSKLEKTLNIGCFGRIWRILLLCILWVIIATLFWFIFYIPAVVGIGATIITWYIGTKIWPK